LKNYMPINLKSGRNRQISAHTWPAKVGPKDY
jgi:hypothetical protein